MSIELAQKYSPKVDEVFSSESKISLLTNSDYDFTGAHSVKIYKVTTADMNDYDRHGEDDERLSRYGQLKDLNATTEEKLLTKDRSFIFNIDKMDEDETDGVLTGETALNRQIREKVVPEVDKCTYKVMCDEAGTSVEAALDIDNVYDEITKGTQVMDDAEVPDDSRALVVVPSVYSLIKKSKVFDNTEIGAELRQLGVVGVLDGMNVIKVPSSKLPSGVQFMIAHPCATCTPFKLEDYGVHNDTPLSSGTIVTGRIVYDSFVLDNKKKAIYVCKTKTNTPSV